MDNALAAVTVESTLEDARDGEDLEGSRAKKKIKSVKKMVPALQK